MSDRRKAITVRCSTGRRSSPEARKEASARKAAAEGRLAEVQREIKAAGGWEARLAEAARFAVDVKANPPSLERLAEAVLAAERVLSLREEECSLRAVLRGSLRWMSDYYQWSAGVEGGIAGFGVFHVYGRGDTKKEALAKARDLLSGKPGR